MLTDDSRMSGSRSLYWSLFLLGICLVYAFFIYPLFRHPLREIPRAHWSVAFPYVGSLWILKQRYRMRGNATTYKAHQTHGEVVRLGYEELSINCVNNGIRTVYGGGWEKHEWYARKFARYGVINMFSTVHRGPHSQKKRTMANVYSKSHLQLSPQLKCNSVFLLAHRFLPLLQSFSDSGEAVDVHDMNHSFTMDFMSAYLFGISCSTNFVQDGHARREVMHQYQSRRDHEWQSADISPFLRRCMATVHGLFMPQDIATANHYLEMWTANMCEAADRRLAQKGDGPPADGPGDEPVVYKQLKTGLAKLRSKDPEAGREILPHISDPSRLLRSRNGFEIMSRNELYGEMFDHLEAGHVTSAIGLTYLYWELSRDSSIQDRLNMELLQLTPQVLWPRPPGSSTRDFELPPPTTIDSLPYLDAVVMETLRLHAPIPGNEPRISPYVAGGSTLGRFSAIPGGVRVSAMPFTLHRNAEVFHAPEVFDPDRWLTSDQEKLKEMHRWFWAFGSGGRMCIGSHLAVQEMKLLVAAIYSNWRTEVVNDQGIEEIDGYTARPRSNKLMLKFTHRR